MYKNVAGQKIVMHAVDSSGPKTGDAANITVYLQKDDGALTALGDTSATELSNTNGKGDYVFDLTQAETNASKLHFTGKSTTSGVSIIPRTIWTRPPYFDLLAIDSSGRVDVSKIAGTSQTARDLGASVLLSVGTGAGQLSVSGGKILLQDGAISRNSFAADSGMELRLHGTVTTLSASGGTTINASSFNTTNYTSLASMAGMPIVFRHYTQAGVYFRTRINTHTPNTTGDFTIADPLPWNANAGTNLWVDYSPTNIARLSSDGLDGISTTAPSGVASTFREMMVQLWRRFFKKTVYNASGNTIITYADNGSTPITTQTATSSGGTETQDAAT